MEKVDLRYLSNFLFLLSIVFCLLSVVGCEEKREVRMYTENVSESPLRGPMERLSSPHAGEDMSVPDDMKAMITATAVSSSPLKWTTPQAWSERAGSGMRVASFVNSSQNDDMKTTIIVLPGNAGGVEANVARWLGQLNVMLSSQELDQFLAQKETIATTDGLSMQVFDFTKLAKGAHPLSMISTIIQFDDQVVFIKMMGSRASIEHNRSSYFQLIHSLKL